MVEAENATVLASACKDAESFVQKIALLESELVAERRPERYLRGSVESNLRSSPFYRPGGMSCATPALVPHG
jgi:hypothetical protein